jgi:hypothetical protein
VDCWNKLDEDQAKLDVAKANRDKKMAKCQPSIKETKAYTAAVASNKALAAAAAASDYSTCHASLHGCVFDQEFCSCLIHPALYLIAASKSTSLKEPLDPAPAFNLPVSQALQPRPREQMPCFP